METSYPYEYVRVEENFWNEICQKQDEFLDAYSLYLQTRISWVRDEVKLKAYELRILDPNFSFQI